MTDEIFVAGGRGMVGFAVVRRLLELVYPQDGIVTRDREELDLTDWPSVRRLFASKQPEQVYLGAARVGGIHDNDRYPAEFIY